MWVGLARDGAFDEAFDSLFPRARRLAYRILGDESAAEDVAAEALARTCLRWAKVRDLPWRDAWVLRVATNLALDVAKRRRPTLAQPHAKNDTDEAVLRVALVEALHRLPRRQRQVLALRFLSDLSEADVAASLGISAGSVKTHTSRGLASLREHLSDDDLTEVPLAAHGI